MSKKSLITPTVYKVLITVVLLLTFGAMFMDVFHFSYSSSPTFGIGKTVYGGRAFFEIFDYSLWEGASSIIMGISIIAAILAVVMLWLNKPKFTIICVGVIAMIVLLSLFRFYGEDGAWQDQTGDYYQASISSPYYLVICGTALALLFSIVGLLNTKAPDEKIQNIVVSPKSNAEEIGKYSELLEKGIISQEEFDTKKKQLLGL